MANNAEVTSTGQVIITEVSEQVVEVQAPGAPLTVEISTAGPQGAPGPAGVTALAQLEDVTIAAKVAGSVLYYDASSGSWRGDDINTVVTITDGGNW